MGDERLSHKRGTVTVGAIAIVTIFMIVVSCIATVMNEYNRYVYAAKKTSEKILAKGRERLIIEQVSKNTVRIRNEGSTTSFIVGFFILREGEEPAYIKLKSPVVVKVLSTEDVLLPKNVTMDSNVAALTIYGNIFLEETG